MIARRVLARYLAAYKKRGPGLVPVKNQETDRTVYVKPETLKDESGQFRKVPESQLDTTGKPSHPRHPGQPKLPAKPRKPHKPDISRDPPPAPIHPPVPPEPVLPPKKPKPVKPVPAPKVPGPDSPNEYKRVWKYMRPTAAHRVLERFLTTSTRSGV